MTLKEIKSTLMGRKLFLDDQYIGRIRKVEYQVTDRQWKVSTSLNSYLMPKSFLKAMALGEEVCFVFKYYMRAGDESPEEPPEETPDA